MGRKAGVSGHNGPTAEAQAEDARVEEMYQIVMRIVDAQRWDERLADGAGYTAEDSSAETARRHALALLWVTRKLLLTPGLRLQSIRQAARDCGLKVAPWAGGNRGKGG